MGELYQCRILKLMHESPQAIAVKRLEQWVDQAARRMAQAGLVFGHGTDNPVDEACWMAAHVLDLAPDFDDGMLAAGLADHELAELERLLQQRIDTRRPLAYLIGEAWFAGLRFRVDDRVLVPRSPLAELILEGFAPWLDLEHPVRALDVGTGSGCLAAALAWHWPWVEVDAVDISQPALTVAVENVRRLGLDGRVRVIESDLLAAVSGRRYGLIMSNPPYVRAASMSVLAGEYRAEPPLALAAGSDGLEIIRRLLRVVPEHLEPGGILVMEVGEARGDLEALLPGVPFVWLEFQSGGDGVFLLDDAGSRQAADYLEKAR